ncbi:MAG: ABC transporter permease [Bacteroidota bacterium]
MKKEIWSQLSGNVWKKISKRKAPRLAGYFLILLILIALLASLLCNEKPLYVKYKGANLFPAFSLSGYSDIRNEEGQISERVVYATADWKTIEKEKVIWCPIIYTPGKSDWLNADYKSPFDPQSFSENGNTTPANFKNRHWLGTTKTGADVLSGIIHGTRISLTIGILSMLIAGLIGIMLGSIAGFFGDNKIIVSRTGIFISIIFGLPLSFFYGIFLNRFSLESLLNDSVLYIIPFITFILLIISVCIYVTYFIGKQAGRILKLNATTTLPVDNIISRGIEIFNSIPRIVLIITLSAISHPSVYALVLIIGFTSWTEIARLVRAEMLKVRSSEFMVSAEASGIKITRQVFRHALPNVIIPAVTAITLGVASAILTESALSFLGVGVPADVVTWGSLLNEGRQNFSAWWLVVFPGIAIFTTVTAINILGDSLSDVIDSSKR